MSPIGQVMEPPKIMMTYMMMTMMGMTMSPLGKVMEPLLKKLGPSSWECVDSKLAWSRLVRMMIVMVVMMVMMVVVVMVLTANSHGAGCQG